MIPLFVGYDQRESAAYHVFCQSVLDTATEPVQFIPLHGPMLENFDGQQDGTNRFIYSRYLVPELMGFNGWALFADSDMVVQRDIAELWKQRGDDVAVAVVPHAYQTNSPKKFIGSPIEASNVNYPRKNWSSLMLWNCGHPAHRILTKEFVAEAGGKFLHRFEWLSDDQIGYLEPTWNWLVTEFPSQKDAKVLHYTLGVPGFGHYADCDCSEAWHGKLLRALNIEGENPVEMVTRAQGRADGNYHKLRDVADSGRRLSGTG